MTGTTPMTRRLVVFLLFFTTGIAAGMVLTGRMRTAEDAVASQAQPAAPVGRPAITGAAQSLPDLTGIAERAVRAVTSISTTSTVRSPVAVDPFGFFYRDEMIERRAQSLGSGVIVSADGYVVTNNHVIETRGSKPQVSVILADKREFVATVVGTDEQTDLAILKIDARNLPTLAWGDSAHLKVAEWVLAIGNPFGVFSQTVTLGIVSATSRNVEGLGTYEDFIQTDAAINRGNSGGALINARGELVGINSAIYSETGGYQGIGLAVPSNLVRKTMDELIKNGVVTARHDAGDPAAGDERRDRPPGRCARTPRARWCRASIRSRQPTRRGCAGRRDHRDQRHQPRERPALPEAARRQRNRLDRDADYHPRRPPRDRARADRAGRAVPPARPLTVRPLTAAESAA